MARRSRWVKGFESFEDAKNRSEFKTDGIQERPRCVFSDREMIYGHRAAEIIGNTQEHDVDLIVLRSHVSDGYRRRLWVVEPRGGAAGPVLGGVGATLPYSYHPGACYVATQIHIAKGDRNGYVVEASYFARRSARDEQIRYA